MKALSRWWQARGVRRDERVLRRRPIPDPLWQLTVSRYPFLATRSADDLIRLRSLCTLFLDRKQFTGAQGFEVGDDIALAISAQACLPVLHLGLSAYDGFVGIVVHADEVVARREVTDDDGVVHEYDETLAGEAMHGGPVMLSWRDVEEAGASASWGYNVVIHEFAHVLDLQDGVADGVPPLPDRAAHAHWLAVMEAAYQRFCRQLDKGVPTVVDPYGAESIDEFFAVASEHFFVAPHDFREEHPQLYDLLAGYYRQNPIECVST